MNVFEMIIEVKKEVETFFKDTKSFGGYKYVSGSQVLERITPKMNELGLLFIPSSAKHTGWERHEYKTAAGKDALDFIVQGDLTYRFVNANDPKDFYEIPFVYYGQQDDISKAFGSALTYSERYLLLKAFGLPTDDDDPDAKPQNPYGSAKKDPMSPTYVPSTPVVKALTKPTEPQKQPDTPIITDPTVNHITEEPKSVPVAILTVEQVAERNKNIYGEIVNTVYTALFKANMPSAEQKSKTITKEYWARNIKVPFADIELSDDPTQTAPNIKGKILVKKDEILEGKNKYESLLHTTEQEINIYEMEMASKC